MKICNKCSIAKEESEYHKHSMAKDGLRGYCKICACKMRHERYINNVEKESNNVKKWNNLNRGKVNAININWRKRNPNKRKAHIIVTNAISLGKLVRKPCEICGNPKSHAHHKDYSKPLEIIWLCPKHHKKIHSTI